jgi:hypothetical protein
MGRPWSTRTCDVPGCERKHCAKGLCRVHRKRMIRNGSVDTKALRPTADRFWEKVDQSGDCWIWKAYVTRCGYGRFRVNGQTILAHRQAWILTRGPIPPDLTIDHLCRVTRCVNPDHMELVSGAENSRRGVLARLPLPRREQCANGHPLVTPNLRVLKTGATRCRVCEHRKAAARHLADGRACTCADRADLLEALLRQELAS